MDLMSFPSRVVGQLLQKVAGAFPRVRLNSMLRQVGREEDSTIVNPNPDHRNPTGRSLLLPGHAGKGLPHAFDVARVQ